GVLPKRDRSADSSSARTLGVKNPSKTFQSKFLCRCDVDQKVERVIWATRPTDATPWPWGRRSPCDARQETRDGISCDLRARRVEVDQVKPMAGPRQRHQHVRHASGGEFPLQEF